eukprot:gene415-10084_t
MLDMSSTHDRRVPVCPLCNQPVSIKPGEIPDRRVNDHIESDCKSDLALAKRKTYTNKCSVKGCKQRELVPVTCATCRKNFCLRHRHENDHECIDLTATSSKGVMKSSAAQAAGQAAAARFESYNTSRRKQAPMRSTASATSNTSNSNKQLRNQSSSQGHSQTTIQNHQGGMTEDEALAFALQASLADTHQPKEEEHSSNAVNSDEDSALARAIAQSEIDERNRQREASQVADWFIAQLNRSRPLVHVRPARMHNELDKVLPLQSHGVENLGNYVLQSAIYQLK